MNDTSWIRGVIDGMAMDEPVELATEEAEGWLILKGNVPERWRDRAVPLYLVPLLPQEAEQVVAGSTLLPDVHLEEEPLLRLVARGRKTASIARELGIPLRTIERRLAKLRERFNVASTADLTILLSRLGFGHESAPTDPRPPVAPTPLHR